MPSKEKNCQHESEAESQNCFIILQLVSKTANDRYLAFGVRSNSDNSKGKKAFNTKIAKRSFQYLCVFQLRAIVQPQGKDQDI